MTLCHHYQQKVFNRVTADYSLVIGNDCTDNYRLQLSVVKPSGYNQLSRPAEPGQPSVGTRVDCVQWNH